MLILATKADKLNTTAQRAAVVSAIGTQLSQRRFRWVRRNVTVQLFSATTRIGIAEAEAMIAAWLVRMDPTTGN